MLGFQEGVGASLHFTSRNSYKTYKINGNNYKVNTNLLRLSQKHTKIPALARKEQLHIPIPITVLSTIVAD